MGKCYSNDKIYSEDNRLYNESCFENVIDQEIIDRKKLAEKIKISPHPEIHTQISTLDSSNNSIDELSKLESEYEEKLSSKRQEYLNINNDKLSISALKLRFGNKSVNIILEKIPKNHLDIVAKKMIGIKEMYNNWKIKEITQTQAGQYKINFYFDDGYDDVIICAE